MRLRTVALALATLSGFSNRAVQAQRLEQKPSVQAVPLSEPSPQATLTYKFGYNEALGRVVEKLRGATTSRAWHFSKILLGRETSDEVQRALAQYLERQLVNAADDAPARNAIEAMRRAGCKGYSDVLMRAAGHSSRPLREQALMALEKCASEDAVERLLQGFATLDVRTQSLIVRVVANAWPPKKAIAWLRRLLHGEITEKKLGDLRYQVVKTFELQAPRAVIRGVLEREVGLFPPLTRQVVARQLHEAGSEEGRRALLSMLAASKTPLERAQLIGALSKRDPAGSVDQVLSFLSKAPLIVRVAIARFLTKVPGENAIATLEVLAADEALEVQRAACRALRGRPNSVADRLIEQVETENGSQLLAALQGVVNLGAERAVPAIEKRLSRAKGLDRRKFVQALGRTGQVAAVPALLRVFLAKPEPIATGVNSVEYAAILLTNIPAAAPQLWRVWEQLEGDEARRSHLLKTLGNLAKGATADPDPNSPEQKILRRFRKILFDAEAPVRDRLQILGYLRPTLSLDDAMKLRRLLGRGDAVGPPEFLRQLNDFLWEFF